MEISIGGNLHGRIEERRQERPAVSSTQVLEREPEPEPVEVPRDSRTISEAVEDLKQVSAAKLQGGRLRYPDEDQISLISGEGEPVLTLSADKMLEWLNSKDRVKEVYEQNLCLARGWSGKLAPNGGEILAAILGLPLRIGDTVYQPESNTA